MVLPFSSTSSGESFPAAHCDKSSAAASPGMLFRLWSRFDSSVQSKGSSSSALMIGFKASSCSNASRSRPSFSAPGHGDTAPKAMSEGSVIVDGTLPRA